MPCLKDLHSPKKRQTFRYLPWTASWLDRLTNTRHHTDHLSIKSKYWEIDSISSLAHLRWVYQYSEHLHMVFNDQQKPEDYKTAFYEIIVPYIYISIKFQKQN